MVPETWFWLESFTASSARETSRLSDCDGGLLTSTVLSLSISTKKPSSSNSAPNFTIWCMKNLLVRCHSPAGASPLGGASSPSWQRPPNSRKWPLANTQAGEWSDQQAAVESHTPSFLYYYPCCHPAVLGEKGARCRGECELYLLLSYQASQSFFLWPASLQ